MYKYVTHVIFLTSIPTPSAHPRRALEDLPFVPLPLPHSGHYCAVLAADDAPRRPALAGLCTRVPASHRLHRHGHYHSSTTAAEERPDGDGSLPQHRDKDIAYMRAW
jgi:hypothetical protein